MKQKPIVDDLSELLSRLRNTDLPTVERETAFAALVGRFQNMAFALAYARLRSREQAEDAAQSTFIEVWRKSADLRDDHAFVSWLRRIVVSQCREITRRAEVSTAPLEQLREVAEDGAGPIEAAVRRETTDSLRFALEALAEEDRDIVGLFYIGEYTSREIGALLEIPETTVKKRLRTARAKLKETLLRRVQQQATQVRLSRSDRFGNTIALFNAAGEGDTEKARQLLTLDPSLARASSLYGGSARSALHVAASAGHTPIVRHLLAAGADVRGRDAGDNATALHWAAEHDHREIVRLLIAAGADVNAADDKHGIGPLGWATHFKQSNREVAQILIAAGAQVGIFAAVALGDAERVHDLIRADPAQLTRRLSPFDGAVTPLAFALRRGQAGIARTLVALGATDMTLAEVDLTIAFEADDVAALQSLLRDNPTLAADLGGRLVIQATRRGWHERCRILIESGAPLNAKDADGATSLHRASWNGDRTMAKMLLEAGADPAITDDRYHADAYGWADENRQAELMAFWTLADALRNCDVQMTRRTAGGETALDVAEGGSYAATIGAISELGGTPTIALAILFGEEDAVRRFLAYDPAIIGGTGARSAQTDRRTPLHQAVRAARPAIVQSLLALGADR